jgi:hypothetical protein
MLKKLHAKGFFTAKQTDSLLLQIIYTPDAELFELFSTERTKNHH